MFLEIKELPKVVGIDISNKSIQLAKEKALRLGASNLHFLHADIKDYLQEEILADIVFCQGSLIYMKDSIEAINLLTKKLKSGGCLFFTMAADSFIAKILNMVRYILSTLPEGSREHVVKISSKIIPILKNRFWRKSLLKGRGASLEKGIKVNLFLPFASLLNKDEIINILKCNNMEIKLWETSRTFGCDLFYLVKARKL